MTVKCFPHNNSLSGVLNFHYSFSTIFAFPSSSIWAKRTALTVVTIKPTFPKGKEKTRKKIDTLEKSVVKIHSRDLRYKKEGTSLCDQYFLLKDICHFFGV